MYRVTSTTFKDDFLHNLGEVQRKSQEVQNQIATGHKVRLPHEDPTAAIHSMRYHTRLTEIEQFRSNAGEGKSRIDMADSALDTAQGILHRLRELSVTGANGTYTDEDRRAMATEANQLLEQLVEISNTKYKDSFLFAGHETRQAAFRARVRVAEHVEVVAARRYDADTDGQILQEPVLQGLKVDIRWLEIAAGMSMQDERLGTSNDVGQNS